MDVMALRRSLMMQMIGGTDMGAWKQKTVTLQSAIATADGFKSVITSNIPAEASFAIIAKDNIDATSYINNQFIVGYYGSRINDKLNSWQRYRDNSYTSQAGASTIWSSAYALTGSVGDSYTIFYQ